MCNVMIIRLISPPRISFFERNTVEHAVAFKHINLIRHKHTWISLNTAYLGCGFMVRDLRCSRFSYVVLLLAFSFLFVAYMVRFGYGVLLPKIIEDLKISHVEAASTY